MFGEKSVQLVKRDGVLTAPIIEIGVDGTGFVELFCLLQFFTSASGIRKIVQDLFQFFVMCGISRILLYGTFSL